MDSKIDELPQQIQLELPDYSQMYWEWTKKKIEEEKNSKNEETVIIIDIC